MNQIVKDKMQREIMVVNASVLFKDTLRETRFYNANEYDFGKMMIDNYEYMIRGEAEINNDYKQPLPYAAIVDQQNRIFVYQRGGNGSNAGEKRLHSKISIGVGGHIEREDEDSTNILTDSLIREVIEEINTKEENIGKVDLIGYINDDGDEVGKVHMGIFFIVNVSNSDFDLLDGELDNGEFVTLEKLEDMVISDKYDLESWSKIVFNPLKEYLSNS